MQVETPQSVLQFGIARCDITPPVGIYHRMWGAATHERAAGVHRPLVASAMALAPSNAPIEEGRVIITLDHCLLGEVEIQLLKQLIQPARHDQLLITFTHTHGAGLMSLDRADLPGGDLIEPYLRDVGERCRQIVAEARASAAPATIIYGTGRCSLATNRDFWDAARQKFVCGFNPAGTADDTVVVARVTNAQGKTLATIVNYACHPTTLAWQNELISPDYIGALRETVERETGGAPCIFLQGASAELGPREGFVGETIIADRNGRQLGYAALEALTSLPPAGTSFRYQGPTISGATLGTWEHVPCAESRSEWLRSAALQTRRVELAYRDDLPQRNAVQTTLIQQQAREQAALAAGDALAARDARALVERQTRLLRRLAELPPERYPYDIQALRFGDGVWLGVRGELYSALQTAVRREFPQLAIIVMTLVDGWGPSYVVPRETYGKGLYQESIAVLAPGTFEQVVDEAVALVRATISQ
jgi:hypothetical protein